MRERTEREKEKIEKYTKTLSHSPFTISKETTPHIHCVSKKWHQLPLASFDSSLLIKEEKAHWFIPPLACHGQHLFPSTARSQPSVLEYGASIIPLI
jgi:hypothetical protein